MKKLLVATVVAHLVCFSVFASPDPTSPGPASKSALTVSSPNGQLSFHLSAGTGDLLFRVEAGGKPVVENSPLRFVLDGRLLTSGAVVRGSKKFSIHEQYDWVGVHTPAVNDCNGLTVDLAKDKTLFSVEIRVFNDGAAFRVIVPGAPGAQRIPDEASVFRLPGEATIWYHDINGHYEGTHVKKKLADVRAEEWVAPPATLKLPSGSYMAITEANLQRYSGMVLQSDGKDGLVVRLANHQPASHPFVLRYSADDVARLAKPAVVKATISTPWRVMIIGADLNTLVNSDIVTDLCAPPDARLFPQGLHEPWLRPGRAVWKYLDGGGDGTPEVMKHFTDEAARLGFEYNILEGFWRKWTDEQLKDLVDYSRERHVGIWVWMHSKDLHDSTARRALFQRCHDLGIAGLKIDFFDHEAKEVIDLYDAILRETAEQHLLVDFHGSNKPTGLSRTWPNEMTREAVRGMESSRLADRATHETTLP
ncbi:glycoside hydrolase family 97 N-terminal domain-containing protein, partial [Puia sp.]|uniref:glycoside hydrolase family 97 N-terminal domain-containing protein n=1 Tax=Puia sp. TaxID=2045100 RepID=UPI002F3ED33C